MYLIEVFLDDWALYTLKTNHFENVRCILEICRESGLCHDPKKIAFMVL